MSAPQKKNFPSLLIGAFLVLITIGLYWPATHFDFTNYDDAQYVTQNRQVLRGFNWQGVQWAFAKAHAANYHPLTWLSHMLDVQLFGLRAGPHHLINICFHAANTLLLFLVLRKLTGALWRSAFVAALFAIHPLHVESVAWIAERKDMLSTFFGLLALGAYALYAQQKNSFRIAHDVSGACSNARAHFIVCYCLCLVLFLFSLLCKPMLVTFPFLLLLIDYWPLGRISWSSHRHEDSSGIYSVLIEKLPFLALTVASSIITFQAQTQAGAASSFENLPLTSRVVNAVMAWFGYVTKMFWPDPLAVFYPYRQDWPAVHVIIAWIAVFTITAAAAWYIRRKPYFTVGWFWYLGTLVPVIGIIQVGAQAMADRYTYVPLIGLFIAIAWAANELLNRGPSGRIVLAAIAALVLVSCAFTTTRQLTFWENTGRLCRHALRVTTDNYPAHAALGAYLLEHNKIEEAKGELVEALRLNPQHASAHYLLGAQFSREGKFAEARAHLEQAIKLHPTFVEGYIELAQLFITHGQAKPALDCALKSLSLEPNSPDAHFSAASALLLENKLKEALPHYQAALKEKPDFAEAQLDWGKALLHLGHVPEAEPHLRAAASLQPDNLEVHRFLAEAYARQNRPREQASEYERMLQLAPDWAEVLNNLAWLFATESNADLRNGMRAVTLAEHACALTQRTNYFFLSTLAAAYAEAGDFVKATKAQEAVCASADAQGQTDSAEAFHRRLELYIAQKPYHKPETNVLKLVDGNR